MDSLLKTILVTGNKTFSHILTPLPQTDRQKVLSVKDFWGWTTLHWAAHYSHPQTITCIANSLSSQHMYQLLKIQNGEGNTALHLAAEKGHAEVIRAVETSLAANDLQKLVLIQNGESNSVFHLAVLSGHDDTEVLELLVNSLSSDTLHRALLSTNRYGNSPIHYAATRCHIAQAECLLANLTANQCLEVLGIRNTSQQTAEDCARLHKQELSLTCLQEFTRISNTSLNNEDTTLQDIDDSVHADTHYLHSVCSKLSLQLTDCRSKVRRQREIIRQQRVTISETRQQLNSVKCLLRSHGEEDRQQLRGSPHMMMPVECGHNSTSLVTQYPSIASEIYETVDYNPDDVIQKADDVTREVSEADSQSTYALDIHSLES